MSELRELLARVGAPDALVEELRDGETLDQAWERVDAAGSRVWLGAVSGVPVEHLLQAAAASVVELAAGFPAGGETLKRTVTLAAQRAEAEVCLEAAAACDVLAEEGPGGYRGGSSAALTKAAEAAALVARAAEGLSVAEARAEAGRLERARSLGATLGMATHAALGPPEGPLRLDARLVLEDPGHGMLLYGTALIADAMARVAEARGLLGEGAEAVRRVDAELRRRLEG